MVIRLVEGRVDLNFECLHNSASANGNLAEAVEQMGRKVAHPNKSKDNPGPGPDESPCTNEGRQNIYSPETWLSLCANASSLLPPFLPPSH